MSESIRMSDKAIAIFTFKSREHILAIGGTNSWALNRAHARTFPWVVCCRNANNPAAEGTEPHGSAFIVGRVKDIIPSPEPGWEHRWLIQMDEYAEVAIPQVWQGWRNPVRYTTLEDLGIDPSTLTFMPMPAPAEAAIAEIGEIEQAEDAPFTLTIARAKEGLANTFGVTTEAVEITIRG